MEIVINTSEPLSSLEKQVLSVLLNGDAPNVFVQAAKKAESEDVWTEPAPKRQPAEKKAAVEPTPEPMAEEPLVEPEVEEEVDDEQSDEDLLALAVKKATEMVAGGQAAQVREALDAAGASRVRELNKDNVRDFFGALA